MYYPKISIVTPCYNVKDTIEATLKSIHDQNYPNLEHIIMDGGSTDGTVDIINTSQLMKAFLTQLAKFIVG